MSLAEITSVSRLRTNLKETIADLSKSGTVLVLKHSKPVAALLPYSEYEEYVRYLEDKRDLEIGRKRAQQFLDNPDDFVGAEEIFED